MYTTTYGKHIRRPLITLSITLTALYCGVALAQHQPSKSQVPTAQPKMSQRGPTQEQALVQLADQIASLEFDLAQMHERFGESDRRVVHAQKELAKLVELQKKLVLLSDGELNESKKAEISRLIAEISATAYKSPQTSPAPSDDQLAILRQELQHHREQLAEREKQMAMLAQQVASQQRRRDLPALEGAQAKGYTLRYVPAREAAQTIESLIGTATVRLAVDERTNSLIIYGKADSLGALETLLAQIDRQASPQAPGEKPKQDAAASPRSLLVRVFWLADNLPESAGQNPADFLPKSVLEATHKLGLEKPRLVTQTVNSLATGKEDAVDFSTSVPAVLLEQPVGMNCEGKLKLVADDRVRVDMSVHVGGQMMNCDLRGSMATPLGHYMVLGTANSMIAEGGTMAGGMPGGPGMGIRRGGFASGPERAAPAARAAASGGFRPEGEFADPTAALEFAPPTKPKFETSRFAFVVQVIEGQSYEAEKAKSDGE